MTSVSKNWRWYMQLEVGNNLSFRSACFEALHVMKRYGISIIIVFKVVSLCKAKWFPSYVILLILVGFTQRRDSNVRCNFPFVLTGQFGLLKGVIISFFLFLNLSKYSFLVFMQRVFIFSPYVFFSFLNQVSCNSGEFLRTLWFYRNRNIY